MVIWLVITAFLLTSAGIIALFDIPVPIPSVKKLFRGTDRTTLADDVAILSGHPPKGFFKRQNYETALILKATGRESRFETIKVLSAIGVCVGVFLAILLNNLFLIPVLGFAVGYLPFFYIRKTAGDYKKAMNEELERALSQVTTSYMRSNDIRKAVSENMTIIKEPVYTHFKEFLTATDCINPNVGAALETLKLRIPNPIFHEWINILLQCQTSRTMKYTLENTLQKFSDMKATEAKIQAGISEAKREAILMALMVVGNVPLLYLINKDWFNILLFTIQGKAALGISFAILLFSFIQIHKLSAPVEYREVDV